MSTRTIFATSVHFFRDAVIRYLSHAARADGARIGGPPRRADRCRVSRRGVDPPDRRPRLPWGGPDTKNAKTRPRAAKTGQNGSKPDTPAPPRAAGRHVHGFAWTYLEDGAELAYDELVGLSEERLRGLIKPKERLGVFAPIEPKWDGPNYMPEVVTEKLEDKGFRREDVAGGA